MRCPVHGCKLLLEEADEGRVLYVCPQVTAGCSFHVRRGGERERVGPQRHTGGWVDRPASAGDVWRRR